MSFALESLFDLIRFVNESFGSGAFFESGFKVSLDDWDDFEGCTGIFLADDEGLRDPFIDPYLTDALELPNASDYVSAGDFFLLFNTTLLKDDFLLKLGGLGNCVLVDF